jgi:hypothetical protein
MGRIYYTNGTEKRRFEEGKQPEGWVRCQNRKLGYHWYTDGVHNKKFSDTDTIPEGFYKGKTQKQVSEETKRKAQEKAKQTNLERYGSEWGFSI